MGKRTRYEPGTFCWVDLETTDPTAAKAFYGALFGWEVEELSNPETTYTMLRLDGDDVAALYEMEAERREQGALACWSHYVSVADADLTASRARELGGTVYGEPFDVFDSGRMAIIQDPTGATVAAWQPKAHIGASRVNDPGCLTWNELATRDPERAMKFYTELFGWDMEPAEQDGTIAYVTIKNAGALNGGIMPMTEQHGDAPPHWLAYFVVPSTDEGATRVKELGGAVLAEPFDVPVVGGRIAVVRDPQGATFALFAGETDD